MTERQTITTTSAEYDAHSLEEYATKWVNNMGLGEMAINDTRKVSADGVISLSAVPFQIGADGVSDHAKYYAVSRDAFPMPESGSLEFSVDIAAATPGTEPGRVIHGSYTGTPDGGRPYAQPTIEGQQSALMFNMTNVETGQLFDWFVSGRSAFALIERLPSILTSPTLAASDPTYVGLDRMYTQIVKSAPLTPGETHTFAIRYTRHATRSSATRAPTARSSVTAWSPHGHLHHRSRALQRARRLPVPAPRRTRPRRLDPAR